MKQFNDNFTTPEQSKRLLEFGVPADSADCIIAMYQGIQKRSILSPEMPTYSVFLDRVGRFAALAAIHPNEEYLPCWSVGRLIEIFDMCCVAELTSTDGWWPYRRLHKNQTYIDYILFVFTTNKIRNLLDFSKLED